MYSRPFHHLFLEVHMVILKYQNGCWWCIWGYEDIFSEKNDKYLPDLPNEKNWWVVSFEQVFHRNEVFNRIHQDIINWHLSDECNRYYPKLASYNRNAYKMKCRSYIYDKAKNILYKKVKYSDGIGKWIFNQSIKTWDLSKMFLLHILKCVSFVEWNIEVIYDLKWQNALLTAAHEGLGNSVTSQSLSGHFGRDKMCDMLQQRSNTYLMQPQMQYYVHFQHNKVEYQIDQNNWFEFEFELIWMSDISFPWLMLEYKCT